jgi:hypothetical protein
VWRSTEWRFVKPPIPTVGRWEARPAADNLSAASGNGGAAYRISPPANLRRHPLAAVGNIGRCRQG